MRPLYGRSRQALSGEATVEGMQASLCIGDELNENLNQIDSNHGGFGKSLFIHDGF